MIDKQQLDDFERHARALFAETGVDPTDEQLVALFQESAANGFTPEATETAFDVIGFGDTVDDEYDEPEVAEATSPIGDTPASAELMQDASFSADRLATKLGRPLTARER